MVLGKIFYMHYLKISAYRGLKDDFLLISLY